MGAVHASRRDHRQFLAPPRSERATANEPPGSATPFSELPRRVPLFGGRLVLGAGPTFIFPTASARELGQDTWQVGPDVGATLLGKHFIAYGFVQQWFKVGGDGAKTNQMNGVFNFTYTFANGWTIGTQPSLSVNWEAPKDERRGVCDRTTGRKVLHMRGLADVVPDAGAVLPRSSKHRRSEVEHSTASSRR